MKYHRNEAYEDKILDDLMAEIEEDRSDQFPGVTSLIYCITKTYWERLHGKPTHDRDTKLFFSIGLGLERALLNEQKQGLLTGSEDGIFYHLDGLVGDEVAELKSTRISTRTKIDKNITKRVDGNYRDVEFPDMPEAWIKQMLAYCKVKGTTKAKLIVLHVIQPDIRVWDVEFSPVEVEANWKWLQDRKKVLMFGLKYGRPPTPFQYNQDFECERCAFLLMCKVQVSNAT